MACLQYPKYVCFARIAGCHLRQLSTTDRGISLVEAITQGVLRGMEALLQWSSFSARLLGTTLACHSYSLYISPLWPRSPSPVWRRGPYWWSQCDRSRHWWPHCVRKRAELSTIGTDIFTQPNSKVFSRFQNLLSLDSKKYPALKGLLGLTVLLWPFCEGTEYEVAWVLHASSSSSICPNHTVSIARNFF